MPEKKAAWEKWIDTRTGRIMLVDPETDEIQAQVPTLPEPTAPPINFDFNQTNTLTKPNLPFHPMEPITKPGHFVSEILPGAGAIGGGFAGGFPGGAAGAFTGNVLKNILQTQAPEVFGDPEVTTPTQMTSDAIQSSILDLLTGGVAKGSQIAFTPSARRNVISRGLQKIFPPDQRLNPTQYTAPHREKVPYDLTIGQVNERAGKLVENWARKEMGGIIRAQRDAQAAQFRHWQYPSEFLEKEAQVQARNVASNLENIVQSTRQTFNSHITKNSPVVQLMTKNSEGKLIPRNIKVHGAIPVNQSRPFARAEFERLSKILNPNSLNPASLRVGLGKELSELQDELGKVAAIQVPTSGKPVESINKLQTLHDQIFNVLGKIPDVPENTEFRRGLASLRETLANDIDNGVKGWGRNAYAAYQRNRKAILERANRIDPQMTQTLLKAGASPEVTFNQISQQALNDPQKTRQFKRATQDVPGRGLISKIFMTELANTAQDGSGNFSPIKALDWLVAKKNSGVAKEALPTPQMVNAEAFLRKAALVTDMKGGIENALNLTLSRAATALGVGTGAALWEGDPKKIPAYSAGFMLVPKAMNTLVRKALLDPEYARAVMGLIQTPPASKASQNFAKTVLYGLRGSRVLLEGANGIMEEAGINENGKIVPPNIQQKIPVP